MRVHRCSSAGRHGRRNVANGRTQAVRRGRATNADKTRLAVDREAREGNERVLVKERVGRIDAGRVHGEVFEAHR